MILLNRSTVLSLLFLLSTSCSLFFADAESSTTATTTSCIPGGLATVDPPYVTGKTLIDGILKEVETETDDNGGGGGGDDPIMDVMKLKEVTGCCSVPDGSVESCSDGGGDDDAAIANKRRDLTSVTTNLRRVVIGTMPQFTQEQSLQVLESAKQAWDGGSGTWPQLSLKERIESIEHFLIELTKKRNEIIKVLMWEIGKNHQDAQSEFDRTIQFVRQTIDVIRDPSNGEYNTEWDVIGKTTRAFVRRSAIGIILCLGPFNYPLNETYATLIPALLMGNVIVMKIPTVGGLAHLLTMEAFSKSLPPGAINLISGPGRETMPPLMADGSIDGLAFIGGSNAADDLIRKHPEPHRLKVFLQLEAKNMGIFLPDMFDTTSTTASDDSSSSSLLDRAIDEAVTGSLSYNGQRCTALKILFVPTTNVATFVSKFVSKVEALTVGLPWQTWNKNDNDSTTTSSTSSSSSYSKITPLPNTRRVDYMKHLIDDATSKGAKIMNTNGGTIIGGENDSTLMIPAILYPVTPDMHVYDEEQFGPVVPIVPYDNIDTVMRYGREGKYGQQVSIFTSSSNGEVAASMVDQFATVFGKININGQCGRSPDTLPFSGRRSSAMGIMSVTEALREFSVPSVVAYKDDDVGRNVQIVDGIQKHSRFMESI